MGRRNSIVFDSTRNATVQALVDQCQQKLPPDEEHPDKTEVEHEISELEYRLAQLKESIGAT